MADMFEHYDQLPQEVQEVLGKHAEMDETYENCANLVSDLESVGWTCDYYLDAVPFDLRKIGEPSNYTD